MASKRAWVAFGVGAGLLLWGKKAMATKTEVRLSEHFMLSEFLRSPGFPELAYYRLSPREMSNVKALVGYVLEPLRKKFGPVYISGSMRPDSLKNAQGQTFYEYLKSRDYYPAKESDHAEFAGTDFQLPKASLETYLQAYHMLQENPQVRQVIIYFKTDESGKNFVDHIHVSVIAPGLAKFGPERFSFATLDGKRLDEAYA